jgi:heptaprenyl diphosphate synthase
MRPVLALLGAEFGDPGADDVVTAAVVVELAHLASLYHDDVMDEAPTRRGVVSANARWGNQVAVLAGDFLLAQAAELSAGLGLPALRTQANALSRLVQGQLAESLGPLPGTDPRGHYLAVVSDKTAALLALAVRLGALTAGADRRIVATLGAGAEALGIAFQISDDILDLTASAAASGKQSGIDLLRGVPTLPILYARETGPDELRALLADDTTATDERLHRAMQLIRDSPAIAMSHADVERYAGVARDAFAGLPDRAAAAALGRMCAFVVGRTAGHALTP